MILQESVGWLAYVLPVRVRPVIATDSQPFHTLYSYCSACDKSLMGYKASSQHSCMG